MPWTHPFVTRVEGGIILGVLKPQGGLVNPEKSINLVMLSEGVPVAEPDEAVQEDRILPFEMCFHHSQFDEISPHGGRLAGFLYDSVCSLRPAV